MSFVDSVPFTLRFLLAGLSFFLCAIAMSDWLAGRP